MNLAHYQAKCGEISLAGTLATLEAEVSNDEQVKMLADGMEIFIGVLGNLCSGLGEAKH